MAECKLLCVDTHDYSVAQKPPVSLIFANLCMVILVLTGKARLGAWVLPSSEQPAKNKTTQRTDPWAVMKLQHNGYQRSEIGLTSRRAAPV